MSNLLEAQMGASFLLQTLEAGGNPQLALLLTFSFKPIPLCFPPFVVNFIRAILVKDMVCPGLIYGVIFQIPSYSLLIRLHAKLSFASLFEWLTSCFPWKENSRFMTLLNHFEASTSVRHRCNFAIRDVLDCGSYFNQKEVPTKRHRTEKTYLRFDVKNSESDLFRSITPWRLIAVSKE